MTQPLETGQAIFFDLPRRAKFRITGTDKLRFLNGQITNDLHKASETAAIEACVLNAKGKLDAHIFVSESRESFLVDAEPELRETLKIRLERYVIADDVQIEDVTDQFALFHVLSQQSPGLANCRIISARRFAETGWDIWVEVAQHDAVVRELSLRSTLCDSDAAEIMRIEQGIPRWGHDLTQEIIPIEANLERRTIDYQKGCYIGQEVISRMKMSGQTNKRLCGLISLHNIRLQPDLKLTSHSAPGKEVGWITSATRSESIGKEIALGYVKRGFNDVGSRLATLATKNSAPKPFGTIPIEVVPLPFS